MQRRRGVFIDVGNGGQAVADRTNLRLHPGSGTNSSSHGTKKYLAPDVRRDSG